MHYEPELILLRETLRKCRIQSTIADLSVSLEERKDLPLHTFLRSRLDSSKPLRQLLPPVHPCVIYRITDPFSCRYIYLPLQELGKDVVLVIGPYLPFAPDARQIMELAEKNAIPPAQQKSLERLYGGIPVLPETSHLFALLEVFAEKLWGANGFTVEDVDQESLSVQGLLPEKKAASDENDLVWNMRNMEQRYS